MALAVWPALRLGGGGLTLGGPARAGGLPGALVRWHPRPDAEEATAVPEISLSQTRRWRTTTPGLVWSPESPGRENSTAAGWSSHLPA